MRSRCIPARSNRWQFQDIARYRIASGQGCRRECRIVQQNQEYAALRSYCDVGGDDIT